MNTFNAKAPRKEKLVKRLLKVVSVFLSFPSRIARRYGVYSTRITEMNTSLKNAKLAEVVSRNYLLINLFIRAPMVLALSISIYNVYLDSKKFIPYSKSIVAPLAKIPTSLNGNSIKVFAKELGPNIKDRFSFMVKESPIKSDHTTPIAIGFFVSFFGALILSKNPMFKIEQKIKGLLSAQKHLDESGRPWDFVWSPFAIMFYSYNTSVQQFARNTRFWSSINFNPSEPVFLNGDSNVFIVSKRYDLPDRMMFNISNIEEYFAELDAAKSKDGEDKNEDHEEERQEEGGPPEEA